MKQSIFTLMGLLSICWGVLSLSGPLYGDEGTQKWAFKTGGGVVSSPALGADGIIYVGSNDGHLYAIGPKGDLKWKFMTKGAVQSHPALGDDGTIYAGSFDHNLYAVRPDGSLKWKFPTQGRVSSSPALGPDGTIYISSWDRYIYAIRPDGSLKWKFPTRGEIISTPLRGPDGTIYVGSWDHHLYAIKDGSIGATVSKKTLRKEKRKTMTTLANQAPTPPIGGESLDLKVDVGRIRQGPSFQAGVAFNIKKGRRVSVAEKQGDWYFIKLQDGRVGWAHRSLFSLPYDMKTHHKGPVKEIQDIRVNVTSSQREEVIFVLNGNFSPQVFSIGGEKPRLVCDFYYASPGKGLRRHLDVNGEYIRQVRTAFYRDPDKKVRVVLDFEAGKGFMTDQRFIAQENHYVIVVIPAKSD